MKYPLRNLTIAAAFATSLGTGSTAATTDLAFIMDMSGSIDPGDYSAAMTSLAAALTASIPTNDVNNQYSITVISFSDTARLDVGPILVTNGTDLTTVTDAITSAPKAGTFTNYEAAFTLLGSTVNSFGDNSIINMMTDGAPTAGDTTAAGLRADRDALETAGWDSLSFEAINLSGAGETLLSDLAFDTAGTGPQPIFNNPNNITDPLNASFVLQVSDFGTAYNTAISTKVQRVVDPISSVPVPAALPLLLAGLGMFGALRLRKSKTAYA